MTPLEDALEFERLASDDEVSPLATLRREDQDPFGRRATDGDVLSQPARQGKPAVELFTGAA